MSKKSLGYTKSIDAQIWQKWFPNNSDDWILFGSFSKVCHLKNFNPVVFIKAVFKKEKEKVYIISSLLRQQTVLMLAEFLSSFFSYWDNFSAKGWTISQQNFPIIVIFQRKSKHEEILDSSIEKVRITFLLRWNCMEDFVKENSKKLGSTRCAGTS